MYFAMNPCMGDNNHPIYKNNLSNVKFVELSRNIVLSYCATPPTCFIGIYKNGKKYEGVEFT